MHVMGVYNDSEARFSANGYGHNRGLRGVFLLEHGAVYPRSSE